MLDNELEIPPLTNDFIATAFYHRFETDVGGVRDVIMQRP